MVRYPIQAFLAQCCSNWWLLAVDSLYIYIYLHRRNCSARFKCSLISALPAVFPIPRDSTRLYIVSHESISCFIISHIVHILHVVCGCRDRRWLPQVVCGWRRWTCCCDEHWLSFHRNCIYGRQRWINGREISCVEPGIGRSRMTVRKARFTKANDVI